ncbi:MAG: indole-3-glycerol-phosphate synthase [Myxococcota bacterium]
MKRPEASAVFLDEILARKKREVARRLRHREDRARTSSASSFDNSPAGRSSDGTSMPSAPVAPLQASDVLTRLRRPPGAQLRVVAEIKFRSPSAGEIRRRLPGSIVNLTRSYTEGGAAAISVLADGPGFGGTPLDLRRAAGATSLPLLFKEFVLSPVQVELAASMGASMVLLLVRAIPVSLLHELCACVRSFGMEPVVEAADRRELEAALRTEAELIGINARDLQTFSVDLDLAAEALETLDESRIAIFMSGVRSAQDFERIAQTRADAVLIGEGLMRAEDPGARLQRWLA